MRAYSSVRKVRNPSLNPWERPVESIVEPAKQSSSDPAVIDLSATRRPASRGHHRARTTPVVTTLPSAWRAIADRGHPLKRSSADTQRMRMSSCLTRTSGRYRDGGLYDCESLVRKEWPGRPSYNVFLGRLRICFRVQSRRDARGRNWTGELGLWMRTRR